MTLLQAVLFDLDGLLADTEELHVIAYETVGDYLSIDMNRDYICSFIGGPTRENIKRVMADYGIAAERFEEVLKVRYDSYLDAIRITPLKPMDGAIRCLDYVKDRGLKTALVTSSIEEHTRAVLRNVSDHEAPDRDLAALFDAMVFGNEIEHLKPSPDIYIEALRRIDTPATHALALEDSSFGVLAAKKAGLRVIAVPGPHTDGQDFVMADEVATSLTDVLERGLIV